MPEYSDTIFTKTYDLLTWLMPITEGFPKSQRFVPGQTFAGHDPRLL